MLVGFKNTIVCKDRNKSRDDVRKTRDAKLGRCIKNLSNIKLETNHLMAKERHGMQNLEGALNTNLLLTWNLPSHHALFVITQPFLGQIKSLQYLLV